MYKYLTTILILFFQISSLANVITETFGPTGIRHPGCLQSAAEINALAKALTNGDTIRQSYWDAMMNNPKGRIDKTDWIPPIPLTPANFRKPVEAAGQGATRYVNDWIINGTPSSEEAAISILNAWGDIKADQFELSSDEPYLASFFIGHLANAAELLMSSNTSWPIAKQEAFKSVMRELFLPAIRGTRMVHYNANWDLGPSYAILTIAVLLDDKELFDNEIEWLTKGETNARISYYLLPSGQNQESARSQSYSMMGLSRLLLSAQVAWNQGFDLYEANDRSLGKAFEYTVAFNQGEDNLPFQIYPQAVGSGGYQTSISEIGRGGGTGFEILFHHYKNYRGIELPYTKSILDTLSRPETTAPYHMHSTALFWNLDLSEDAAKRQAQPADDMQLNINAEYDHRAFLRVNCGGNGHLDSLVNKIFTKETGQWISNGVKRSHNNPVNNTENDELYQTYRSGNLTYTFQGRGTIDDYPSGLYNLKIHLNEPLHSQKGRRVFNIYSEGTKIFDSVDIYSRAGTNTALILEAEVEVWDGILNVDFESLIDDAVVSAIEIEPSLRGMTLKNEDSGIARAANNSIKLLSRNKEIVMQLPKDDLYAVTLYMLNGKVLHHVEKYYNTGQNTISFDVAKGVYIISIENEVTRVQRRIRFSQ